MGNDKYSSMRAYKATVELLDIVSKRTGSDNLVMLQSIMELTEYGDSTDPAILDSWNEAWGDRAERSEAQTLELVSRFIMQEGIWDDEDRAPNDICASIERYLKGQVADQVIADWRTAVWRDGNRYRKLRFAARVPISASFEHSKPGSVGLSLAGEAL